VDVIADDGLNDSGAVISEVVIVVVELVGAIEETPLG